MSPRPVWTFVMLFSGAGLVLVQLRKMWHTQCNFLPNEAFLITWPKTTWPKTFQNQNKTPTSYWPRLFILWPFMASFSWDSGTVNTRTSPLQALKNGEVARVLCRYNWLLRTSIQTWEDGSWLKRSCQILAQGPYFPSHLQGPKRYSTYYVSRCPSICAHNIYLYIYLSIYLSIHPSI